MLIILFILALIRSLHGVPLASPSEPPDPFTALEIRDTQGHFGQRDISDIIISCFATIFACTWSAVHPNIPAVTDSAWTCFKRRVTITICALLAPELVTYWAMNQRGAAKKIMDNYNKVINNLEPDPKHSNIDAFRRWFRDVVTSICRLFQELPLPPALDDGKGPRWTLAHAFFLQMGGFMLCERGIPVRMLIDSTRPENDIKTTIVWNIQNGFIDPPRILEEDINEYSKGDAISKTFIILQTTWFILQCITRWSQRLPVTELEVITLGFAMLNGITYGLWWHKPQNVGRPVFLESKKSQEASNENYAHTSIVVNHTSDEDSKSNPFSRQADPRKESWLRRKLRQEMEEHAYIPTLLWRIPYRILGALLRPPGKMFDNDKSSVTKMRVGMFYTASFDDSGAALALVAIGILFGFVHLIPSWFLDFPSDQEMWLWRISAIIITVDAILPPLWAGLSNVHKNLGDIVAGVPAVIGFSCYPIARIILLTLSLTALRSLPPPALQTVEWTTFIPHL